MVHYGFPGKILDTKHLLSGTPTPSLTWSKEGAHATEDLSPHVTHSAGGRVRWYDDSDITPNDDDDQVATLRLPSVSRHSGGRYICAAHNGGEAVTSAVRLHVEFAPEIHVDR